MINVPKTINYNTLYAYYKKKTLQEKTFVLIEQTIFKTYIEQGFLVINEVEDNINGFILSHEKDQKSYITMLYGDSIDIKNSLIQYYDSKMIKKGLRESLIHFFNPISLAWYPLNHIIHPCFQGVILNSENDKIYQENGYIPQSIQDTYYQDLKTFEMPMSISEQIHKNQNDGYEIAIYNPNKHQKMMEFTEDIKALHWKKVILENLIKTNPLPLLVALKNNEVIGFTGPLKAEENGRGFFAGIGVLETERGKKIGKTLFFMLCQTLKNMGSSYMTLFTGRDNLARHIYINAGFKVVKTFYTMKKTYK